MPGDYTRATFNPFEDHLGVLMQQGRVMLDADFNELVQIIDRRFRAETIDIIGRCTVPRETPDGFRIFFSGSDLMIGRGRLYANGLLAENHGTGALEFDPILAEQRGVDAVPYLSQPYLPNVTQVAPLPDTPGPHLVYADVWQRELTYLEEPDLMEKAVGVDTAARLQTVWQVKILPDVGRVGCSDEIPKWTDLVRPSAGRLTTATAGVPSDTDPCVVNPAGGFRGTENRLYRIEVHSAGTLGSSSFKWSRDNASIATAVTAINAGLDVLTVVRTGRDQVLRFQPGDWIEVTDDFHEFSGAAGDMRKVLQVDDASETVTLAAPLSAGAFDTAAPASRHTRIRRWDQKGQVFNSTGTMVSDVDASGGVIPVPASGNLVLEDGVQVQFSMSGTGGFHSGDYWLVAARTVDASIDILTEAPPKGIHHHYCRLALVTLPAGVTDCRTLWPPDFGGGGGCGCTVCVSAEEHNSGAFTIQMGIDQVRTSGGRVCLGPGVFGLGSTPIQLQGAASVQLLGHGTHTILTYTGAGAAILISSSSDIGVERISVLAINVELATFSLGIQNSALVRVEQCMLLQYGRSASGGAIGLNGFVVEPILRDNVLFGASGVTAISSGVGVSSTGLAVVRQTTVTFGLRIEDNVIAGSGKGVSLENLTLLLGQTRVSGNTLLAAKVASIVATGLVYSDVLTSSSLDITGNSLLLAGDGILVGVDNARISANDIGVVRNANTPVAGGTGIVLTPGIGGTLDRIQVTGNRITNLAGDGISIRTALGSAMIRQNVMEGINGGAVTTTEAGQAQDLAVENNQILRCGLRNDQSTALSALQIARARQLQVSGNVIDQFATAAVQNPVRFGIEVVACGSVRIEGNDLANVGPSGPFVKQGAGIVVQSPFDRVDVGNNSVRRSTTAVALPVPDSSVWNGVLITSPVVGAAPTSLVFPFITNFTGGFLALGATILALLPTGKEVVGVRGNLIEGYGADSVVKISTGASCVFSDNRCLLDPAANAGPVANIASGAAIINANLLRRNPANDAFFSLLLTTGTGPFTILGNIFGGGRVTVNGAAMVAPWAPLNIVTFS